MRFPEDRFRQWYATWAAKAGLDPDPDAPGHRYDYRGAYASGAIPAIDPTDGMYHWPSRFKAESHPNRFVRLPDGGVLDSLLDKRVK